MTLITCSSLVRTEIVSKVVLNRTQNPRCVLNCTPEVADDGLVEEGLGRGGLQLPQVLAHALPRPAKEEQKILQLPLKSTAEILITFLIACPT